MKYTTFTKLNRSHVASMQAVVARLIRKGLEWRRHGIGCLQAYVAEGANETRIHVWHPDLMLPGIQISGNAHNHRFTLSSSVLFGRLRHTEWHLAPEDSGTFETYDFVHARLQTNDNRSKMRATGKRFSVTKECLVFREGDAYTFERGAFHDSQPESDLVVTLVFKKNQAEERAMVVAPADVPPVPAFGGPELDDKSIHSLLERASVELLNASTTPLEEM